MHVVLIISGTVILYKHLHIRLGLNDPGRLMKLLIFALLISPPCMFVHVHLYDCVWLLFFYEVENLRGRQDGLFV